MASWPGALTRRPTTVIYWLSMKATTSMLPHGLSFFGALSRLQGAYIIAWSHHPRWTPPFLGGDRRSLPTLYHVVHHDSQPWRVEGQGGVSFRAAGRESGDSQGEVEQLEEFARSLRARVARVFFGCPRPKGVGATET